ncbi:MAG: cupredoxin domain-containing protein [Anaerolineales bacterium]
MRRHRSLSLLTLAMALALAACGQSGPSTSIKVMMTDFAFSPNSFTVPAGEQISVAITNNGGVAHSFIIMKLGKKVQGHFSDADQPNVYWGKTAVDPGTSVKDTFTAPGEPGEYQIVCGVAGHFEAGMVAKLTVVSQAGNP